MYIFQYLTLDFCSLVNERGMKTKQENLFKYETNLQVNYQDFPQQEYQDIKLHHYNKVVKDFLSSIRKNPEVNKKISDLLSSNLDIDIIYLFLIFKQYLQQFYLGMPYDTSCVKRLSFIESLSYLSYKSIIKLASITDSNEYKITKDLIINSVDLKVNHDCERKIEQLFNNDEYNKIFLLPKDVNTNEHIIRSKRYAPSHTTTPRQDIVRDDVKKVFMGGLDIWDCIGVICK
ncbi:uncharacterized protein VNE69_03155 [Vairimorpha necatrix]|uniref:Uncharacterized protein n=1 Tax=Vairimorpha necatrix TaxID=6039 RepID=A0AAX4JAJ4_9MICR